MPMPMPTPTPNALPPRLLLGLLLGLLPAAPAQALHGLRSVHAAEGVTEYRLPNGLQVLLAPDPSQPSTWVSLTYRVGAKHENSGETGMAHLLEHMQFKGRAKYPKPWAEFSRRGLDANATTGLERTNYFASFAANEENLRWYLGWQADAMRNSRINARELASEKQVVHNEMEISENNPEHTLYEHAISAMYQWHPYGRTVIGARSDVQHISAARLQAFYRHHYQPDNATLIITGSFDPARVLAWVQQSFGPLTAPQRRLASPHTLDPAQDGERSVTIRRSGGVAALRAAYHVPASPHPDYAAIELLKNILGATPSGRLHQRLVVERKLASRISTDNTALAEPGFLMLEAQLAPGAELAALQAELLQQLEGLKAQPISAQELQRAKTRWLNQWALQFADAQQLGAALAEATAQGDWRLFFQLRDRVAALDLGPVQRVAEAWLLPANRTLARYLPTELPQRAPQPAQVDAQQELRSFVPGPAPAALPAFEGTPALLEQQTQISQLPGGLRLALLPKPTRGGAVQATLSLRMGSATSLHGQASVASLLAGLLDKPGLAPERQALQDRMDALQMSLQVQAEADVLSLSWRTHRAHAVEALALVAQLLRQPRFDGETLEEVRGQQLAALHAQHDDPEGLAGNHLAQRFNAQPRGDVRHARSFDEMAADLQAVSLAQLRSFHQQFYGAAHGQFAAVGDFDAAALRQALQAELGDWQAPTAHARLNLSTAPALPARPAELLATPDKQNAVLTAGLQLRLSDEDEDHAAISLANHLLGGSSDSRLWQRLREAEGLSYSVWSYLRWGRQERSSSWHFGAFFAPQQRARVEQALREELARALREGFSAAELRAAQQALLAERRLARSQDALLANNLATDLYLARRPLRARQVDQALQAVTLPQLNAALRRHLQPDALLLVFAGDFK